jgi:hypothetical protein
MSFNVKLTYRARIYEKDTDISRNILLRSYNGVQKIPVPPNW